MSIFITGDTHGDFRNIVTAYYFGSIKEGDTLIILGDVGLNYYGPSSRKERELKEFIESLRVNLFCIHGNHEMRPQNISSYRKMKWMDGDVLAEQDYPHIRFAIDGEIYNIDGNRTIVMGGAYSVDKFYRQSMGYQWFPDEQPSEEIKKYVEQQLEASNWQVDCVLSHTVPLKYEPVEVFLDGIDQDSVDKTTEIWLGEIEEKLTYKKWYAGHYHTEKSIDKLRLMYHDIEIFDVPKGEQNE